MTIEEYARSNYRFLNRYQAMLFLSHGVPMIGCYVSYDKARDEHNLVYVFEKNCRNEELLSRFRNYQLHWGEHVIEFTSHPAIIVNN